MKAMRIHQFGAASGLQFEELPDPTSQAGAARAALEGAGVNVPDIYPRTGLDPVPLPDPLGQEGVGTVVAVGDGVTTVKAGARVAWTGVFGSYASMSAVPVNRLVAVPAALTTKQAAAAML